MNVAKQQKLLLSQPASARSKMRPRLPSRSLVRPNQTNKFHVRYVPPPRFMFAFAHRLASLSSLVCLNSYDTFSVQDQHNHYGLYVHSIVIINSYIAALYMLYTLCYPIRPQTLFWNAGLLRRDSSDLVYDLQDIRNCILYFQSEAEHG